MEPNIQNPSPGDTHSYKGWLNSDSFIKRSVAVVGYYSIGSIILMMPFMFVIMVIISL